MPERMGKLSNGVGRRHPVAMQSASLIAVFMMWVCTLQHQRGAQYSVLEHTRAKAAAMAPHPDPASRLIRAMREVSFHAEIKGICGT